VVHVSYCSLGLALVISNSPLLFNLIKYAGACYLLYLGQASLRARFPQAPTATQTTRQRRDLSPWASYRQGLLCNLLNPKATLFVLALFTLVIDPETSAATNAAYALEMFCILTLWFGSLTLLLSHPRVTRALARSEVYIAKILGLCLIFFGLVLLFAHK
jgi:threonine/homoserine/homoserine lactone efflux protein